MKKTRKVTFTFEQAIDPWDFRLFGFAANGEKLIKAEITLIKDGDAKETK